MTEAKPYRILITLTEPSNAEGWVNFAARMLPSALAQQPYEIHVCGLITVPESVSPSEFALQAREWRDALDKLARERDDVQDATQVQVDFKPMLRAMDLAREQTPDLLIAQWCGPDERTGGLTTHEILNTASCDVALVARSNWEREGSVLLALRGGPNLSLGVRVARALAGESHITLFNATPVNKKMPNLQRILDNEPHIGRVVNVVGDAAQGIIRESRLHSGLVMGASAIKAVSASDKDNGNANAKPLLQRVYAESDMPLALVRMATPETTEFHAPNAPVILRAKESVSTRVDRWFAQNTYHNSEFEDVNALLAMKAKQGLTISLGLPALNEGETIGKIVRTMKQALMVDAPLLDEIVLIDSNSTDNTADIALAQGIPMFQHSEILPEMGTFKGKGEALWKSLHVLKGDLIVWVDTDIANIHPRFVYGLVGPLLKVPHVQYVKGYYQRPIQMGGKLQAFGGGRVTELVARPLFNLFYPELSGVIQPLSGEYAGRRAALMQVPFFSGYGVETGLLIDLLEKFGLDAIAQTDLEVRIHRNQELSSLSRMAFAIMQVFIARMEGRYDVQLLDKANRTMKMIVQEPERLALQLSDIADLERPPMGSTDSKRISG